MIRIGVDTGGTFTDFVVDDGRTLERFKLPSTPDDPSRAVLEGVIRVLGRSGPGQVLHGTTVATNALLTRSGARVALVTTAGFEDVLEIGRQARARLYDLEPVRPAPLVPAAGRLGFAERTGPRGEVLLAPTASDSRRLLARLKRLKPEAVALVLLHSPTRPLHEARLARLLRRAGHVVSVSHEIAPELREYERTSTTVANAYVQPRMKGYLDRLSRELGRKRGLRVMSSSGGLMAPERAGREPVRTLLSGPAAGVAAARRLGIELGIERLVTFDMGGTSTDVALLEGAPESALDRSLEGLPLRVPMLDIHTVGAGGGSYLRAAATGALQVGPESAGADPGPLAWGAGDELTVTDAHLYLGTLWPECLLGPPADMDLVEDGFAALARRLRISPERAARGALDVADVVMERALRRISVERGHDPADFAMVSFGGAGGLHAARLAVRLGIRRVVVPLDASAFSAWGLLVAAPAAERSRPVMGALDELSARAFEAMFVPMEKAAREELRREGAGASVRLERRVDLRYAGQSFELRVPYTRALAAAFHEAHRKAYGVFDPSRPLEVVAVRVRAEGREPRARFAPFGAQRGLSRFRRPTRYFGKPVPVVPVGEIRPRERVKGPAFLMGYASTVLVPEEFTARRCKAGAVMLEAR